MIRMVRGLIPPRFLPVARSIYSVVRWIIPLGLVRIMQRIDFELSLRPNAYEFTILSRNAKFRNMYAGRRCFVIGNGPSLNKQDLTPLANEVTIVMNFFNKHPIINEWKPTFYCMAEPREGIMPEDLPLFLEGIEAQAYFFLIEVKEIFDKHRFFDLGQLYYLKFCGTALRDWPINRPIDLAKVIPGVRQTAHMAIMLALYMGCSPIYLLGLDQSGPEHFYDETPEVGNVWNAPLGSQIDAIEGTLKSYRDFEALRKIATRNGSAILNATAGGLLEVFERANYEEVAKPKTQ